MVFKECISSREDTETSFLSSQTFSNPENIARLLGGWDARLALLKMVLAFSISQDDGEGGMHILCVVEYGAGF